MSHVTNMFHFIEVLELSIIVLTLKTCNFEKLNEHVNISKMSTIRHQVSMCLSTSYLCHTATSTNCFIPTNDTMSLPLSLKLKAIDQLIIRDKKKVFSSCFFLLVPTIIYQSLLNKYKIHMSIYDVTCHERF